MDECLDLLRELSTYCTEEKQESEQAQQIERLQQKLVAKEKEVLAWTSHLSQEEAVEMIDVLKRKTVCTEKWSKLSTDTFQSS